MSDFPSPTRYLILDQKTGRQMGGAKTRAAAQRRADKLDLEYGEVRYFVRGAYDSCVRVVTREVKRGSMSIVTGETTMPERGTPETGPCNVPLFGDDRFIGLCRGCQKEATA